MSKDQLDAIDRKILRLLQGNGRLTNLELAEQVGLSPSPCLRRIKRLEDEGFIKHFVAVVDQDKVGLGVSVFVQIKVESQELQALGRFETTIRRWPEVLECYLMTGPRDYLLRVVVEDVAAYERFIKEKLTKLEGISTMESSFALSQVKYTNQLPI